MKIQPIPICAEIKGKARALRQAFGEAAAAQERKVAALERMLLARAKADRVPRLDDLEAALAKIEAVGQFGHITMRSQLSKKEYRFSHCRVVPTTLTNENWDEEAEEPGICVVSQVLIVRRFKHFTADMWRSKRSITVLSQHVLERFYQRAFVATDDELVSDLTMLAAAVMNRKLAESDAMETIAQFPPEEVTFATDNGTWRGTLGPVLDALDRPDLVLNVRTFV